MSKKKKSVDKRIIIILLVVLLFMVTVLIALIIANVKNTHQDHGIMGIKYADEIASLPNLTFTNVNALSIYSKDSSKQVEIAKNFEKIFEAEIPNLYTKIEELSSKEIEEYYEENEKDIRERMYNINKEDFLELCDKMLKMESNLGEDYDNCDFQSIENGVLVTCKYKNGEEIKFEFTKDKKLFYKA